jgi:hypothetical protein
MCEFFKTTYKLGRKEYGSFVTTLKYTHYSVIFYLKNLVFNKLIRAIYLLLFVLHIQDLKNLDNEEMSASDAFLRCLIN